MDWEVWVHDSWTGEPVKQVFPEESGAQWSTSLTGSGTSSESFVVNDADSEWTPYEIASTFKPHARAIARWWGSPTDPGAFCMYAQKIEDYAYDKDTGVVVVSAVDWRAELVWRLIGPVSGAPDLVVSGRTPQGAIAAILQRMMSFGPGWYYPIDLPADAPGWFSESWPFHKKFRCSDLIEQVEERAGVEAFFRPYRTSNDGFRFETRVAPAVTFGTSTFNLDADDIPISGIKYKVTGDRQLTGVLGIGTGSGEDQPTKWKGLDEGTFTGIPIRDTKQSFPDLEGDALQQAANVYHAANLEALAQWTVGTFTISDDWPPMHAAPGRVWQLQSYGDPVIPDGEHMLRVVSVSGGNGRELKVEVQSAAA